VVAIRSAEYGVGLICALALMQPAGNGYAKGGQGAPENAPAELVGTHIISASVADPAIGIEHFGDCDENSGAVRVCSQIGCKHPIPEVVRVEGQLDQ